MFGKCKMNFDPQYYNIILVEVTKTLENTEPYIKQGMLALFQVEPVDNWQFNMVQFHI